ncbi:MAG: HAD-IA family hydrolase [Alphaproteobacteria bacterium]|nr:HAD-IA family hydrolase [Alphaproteobacteria bacterium]
MRPLVLFDVADTLIYKTGLFDTIADCLADEGLQREPSEIRRLHAELRERTTFPEKPGSDFYEIFNRRLLESLEIPATEKLARNIFLACKALPWTAFEDTGALTDLNARMGIVSNWDNGLVSMLARYFSIPFDPVVVSGIEGVAKPDTAIFHAALERSRSSGTAKFHVGDSPVFDMEPAAAAGLTPVLIDRFGLYPDFTGRRITSLTLLGKILRG